MTVSVDFYYDFISPFSYLAAIQLPGLASKHDIEWRWLPVNLPRLIKLAGNVPPAGSPNKARYLMRDLKRKASMLNAPLKLYRPGAFDSRPALYVACSLPEDARERFSLAVFQAIYAGRADPREDNWLSDAVREERLPRTWLDDLDGEKAEVAQGRLQQHTEAALHAAPPRYVAVSDPARPPLFRRQGHPAMSAAGVLPAPHRLASCLRAGRRGPHKSPEKPPAKTVRAHLRATNMRHTAPDGYRTRPDDTASAAHSAWRPCVSGRASDNAPCWASLPAAHCRQA